MNKELLAMVKPLKKVVNTDFYVLTNEEKPTEPRTYRNYYHRLMAHLDIPRLKYHGLRHSFATRCIESNCDYKTVSVLLGHANITTTLNLYVHPNMEQKKKCITKMFMNSFSAVAKAIEFEQARQMKDLEIGHVEEIGRASCRERV